MFEPIQIRYSRKKALWGLAVGLVFTTLILSPPASRRWYWAVYLILMLFNNLYIFRALFNRDIVLSIDEQGMRDSRLGAAPIPWERIESVSQHHGERIFLNMSDASHLGLEESRLSILYKPISQIGKAGVVIDARGLEYNFDDIVGFVRDRISYHMEKRHH